MSEQLKPTRTVYTVGQFLNWQRGKELQLKPVFQRHAVWKPKAKSFLIDTVLRGLPMPIIFLRAIQDLDTLKSLLEVVDGQQRLRTLFSFIDPTVLDDYEESRDSFQIHKSHEPTLAGVPFVRFPPERKNDILSYEISTHVFPPTTGDDVVLRIFARINSTGSDLTAQELRNAKFFGAFKTLAADLAYQHLPEWREWGIYSDAELARMTEVEGTSDYLMAIMKGVGGKSKAKLDKHYGKYDDDLPGSSVLETKFNSVLSAIGDSIGDVLSRSRVSRHTLFYSLFCVVYAHMYGDEPYQNTKRGRPLPSDFKDRFIRLDQKIARKELSESVQDAMDKATADPERRKVRHGAFLEELGLGSAP